MLYKTRIELLHTERQHRDGCREMMTMFGSCLSHGCKYAVCSYRTSGQLFEIGIARSDDNVLEQRQNNNNTKFWDSLPNLEIKIFASQVKKKTAKLVYEKVLVSNADRELFCRLVIAAKSRVINLKMSLAKRCQQSPSP